jgi:O-acetyl-ADP-ribose deacetylase (regulator of RNase III)
MINYINGNILESPAQYIVHQLNCVTTSASGLAAQIFAAFPYANVYAHRTMPSKPGTIDIRGDGVQQRFVIGIFGQYYPGKPQYENDSERKRQIYFKSGLIEISKLKPVSVAFPHFIGCGLAGGDWKVYSSLLEEFATVCKDTDVSIVKF